MADNIQIFADINTPFVNDVTVRRVASSKVKENIFQDIVLRPDEAVTEKFSTDTDAAQIQIIRLKPNNAEAREIGASVNGAYFNGNDAETSATEAYGINILTTIDHNIDIPTNMQDMLSVDAVKGELENLSGKVSRNINAMTIATQLAKNFNEKAKADSNFDNWVVIDKSSTAKGIYKNAIIEAGAKLDDGNEKQGIDTYPTDNRAVIIRSKVKASLLKDGEIIIGGSNSAQAMLQKGGLDEGTRPNNITGYLGEMDNMPVYMASEPIWKLAEKYLGLSANALDKVLGIVVSGIGTGRALAFNNVMKIIDTPNGQGKRLQPKYRMGAECWDECSVVPIVEKTFVNVSTADAQLKVLAPGSRA